MKNWSYNIGELFQGLVLSLLLLWSVLANRLKNSYSKTSNNRPSKKRTTSLQRTAHLPPIDFSIEYITFTNLREADTSQLRTTDTDQASLVPRPSRALVFDRLQYAKTEPEGARPGEMYIL